MTRKKGNFGLHPVVLIIAFEFQHLQIGICILIQQQKNEKPHRRKCIIEERKLTLKKSYQ